MKNMFGMASEIMTIFLATLLMLFLGSVWILALPLALLFTLIDYLVMALRGKMYGR
jgi:uncharacterized membrane protein